MEPMEYEMAASGIRNPSCERCGRESMIGLRGTIVSRHPTTRSWAFFLSNVSGKTDSEPLKSDKNPYLIQTTTDEVAARRK